MPLKSLRRADSQKWLGDSGKRQKSLKSAYMRDNGKRPLFGWIGERIGERVGMRKR
jgi:hypothetical protein